MQTTEPTPVVYWRWQICPTGSCDTSQYPGRWSNYQLGTHIQCTPHFTNFTYKCSRPLMIHITVIYCLFPTFLLVEYNYAVFTVTNPYSNMRCLSLERPASHRTPPGCSTSTRAACWCPGGRVTASWRVTSGGVYDCGKLGSSTFRGHSRSGDAWSALLTPNLFRWVLLYSVIRLCYRIFFLSLFDKTMCC